MMVYLKIIRKNNDNKKINLDKNYSQIYKEIKIDHELKNYSMILKKIIMIIIVKLG